MRIFSVAEEPFLFLKRAVVQSTCADRQRPAMGALEQALMMKQLQVLADGDEGGVKAPRKVADEHPAFVLKEFDGLAAAFFVQHGATFLSFSFETFYLFRCNHSDIRNQTRQDSASARTQENFRACLIPETLNVSEPGLTRRLCQTVCRGAGGCQSQCFLDTKAQGGGVSKRSHGGITTADRRARLEGDRGSVMNRFPFPRAPEQPLRSHADCRSPRAERDHLLQRARACGQI